MVSLGMDGLGMVMNSWVIELLIWIGVAGVLGGIGFWYWYNKMVYKYQFIEIDSKGNMIHRKGKITKNNKRIKKFAIKEYNQPEHYLSMKEYNGFFNGKPCRYVSWDGQGNLVYTSGFKVDKEQYLKTALLEVERTEAVDGQMEAAEKVNFMTSYQKWAFGGLVIMFAFMMIGLIMVAKYGFEQAGSISSGGQMFLEASKNFEEVAKLLKANTMANENLINAFVSDYNISINQEITAR